MKIKALNPHIRASKLIAQPMIIAAQSFRTK